MNAIVSQQGEPPLDDVAEAFDRLRRQLALLEAAVAGFAARQDKIAARDYAPDLAKIIELQDRMVDAINTLARRPGVKLTPEAIGTQIAAAAAETRRADHAALTAATETINAMVRRARTDQEQEAAITRAWVWGMATVAGLIFVGQLLVAWLA